MKPLLVFQDGRREHDPRAPGFGLLCELLVAVPMCWAPISLG
jgi:hypothetical protein